MRGLGFFIFVISSNNRLFSTLQHFDILSDCRWLTQDLTGFQNLLGIDYHTGYKPVLARLLGLLYRFAASKILLSCNTRFLPFFVITFALLLRCFIVHFVKLQASPIFKNV